MLVLVLLSLFLLLRFERISQYGSSFIFILSAGVAVVFALLVSFHHVREDVHRLFLLYTYSIFSLRSNIHYCDVSCLH